jgi:hypothetical protein
MSDINTVITTDDLLAYLGIDYGEDDMVKVNILRAIRTADGELRESVGDDYPVDHPLTKELALIYASVSYEERDLSGNESKRAEQLALKLRLVLGRDTNVETI